MVCRYLKHGWVLYVDIRLYSLLGAFPSTVRLLLPVCLSVCCPPVCLLSVGMEQFGSHWTDFRGVWCLSIFLKYIEKIHVSLKSDRITGNLHEDVCKFVIISCWSIRKMRNVSDKSCRENQNTHFVFNNFFPRKSCRFWDNVEKYDRARHSINDSVIRHLRIACWMTEARIQTHSWYLILLFWTAAMVTRTRLSLTLCVHFLCFFYKPIFVNIFISLSTL
jgi:hypothetical protein